MQLATVFRERRINPNSILTTVALIVLMGIGSYFNTSHYDREGWEGFFEFNELRANINDYNLVRSDSEAVQNSSLSANDFEMLRTWNYADRKVFSIDVLRALGAFTLDNYFRLDRVQTFARYLQPEYLFLSMLVALVVFFSGGFRDSLFQFALSSILFFGLGLLLKMPDRVGDAIILQPLMLVRPRHVSKRKLTLTLLSMLILAFSYHKISAKKIELTNENKQLSERLKTLRSMPLDLVVLWGPMLRIEFVHPLDSLESFRMINLFGLGATSQSPFNDYWMERLGFDDIYLYTLNNSRTAIIADEARISILKQYYMERYGLRTNARSIEPWLFQIYEVNHQP
ncbi:MAG: hypothetical protein KF767_07190 [Bdellovibrionaceae bacterium]|nr:hypothetical protein [Pseudobdellovibrionaceae bacterium]